MENKNTGSNDPFDAFEKLNRWTSEQIKDPLEKKEFLEDANKKLDGYRTEVAERFEATRRRERRISRGFKVSGFLFLLCVGGGLLFLGALGAFLGLIAWLLIILIVGNVK
jgi:hypothetical protein